jgi:nucleoporin POM34
MLRLSVPTTCAVCGSILESVSPFCLVPACSHPSTQSLVRYAMKAHTYFLHSTPSQLTDYYNSMGLYASLFSMLVRCIPVLNMSLALLPLLRPKDEMTDMALSREQRQLLGLVPQDLPLPAGSPGYVTPPRYSRSSSTPRSSTQRHAADGSPMSRKGSPSSSGFDQSSSLGRHASGSPFAVSPLMQKAVGGAAAARTLSPLDNSLGSSSSGLATGKASVSLNSKWLYEKGKF